MTKMYKIIEVEKQLKISLILKILEWIELSFGELQIGHQEKVFHWKGGHNTKPVTVREASGQWSLLIWFSVR